MSWLDTLARRPIWLVMALAMILGFAFQGSRGLWEPDEGRYSNVALQMLSSGDYISLRRNPDALHFTKPPLVYWAMAASVQALGRNEWAVRLPMALAYVLTTWLVLQLGRRFVPARPWLPALVYATCPFTSLAANTVNTDTVLTMTLALAMVCYVQERFGGGSTRWLDAMWAAFGLAFLTKGPPALLPLAVIVLFELSQGQGLRRLVRPWGWLAFAVIGLAWYLEVCRRHPGLLEYFLGHEVYDRVATSSHQRSPQWYGPLLNYLPTLTLGALPWFALALRQAWSQRRPWPQMPAELRLLWLWMGLPLLILCLARSRLPLYVLPLCVPLSLLLARALPDFNLNRKSISLLLVWVALLVGLRAYTAFGYVQSKDARPFAAQLRPMLPGAPDTILFVEDMARNGLNLYLDADIKRLSFQPRAKAISDSSFDATLTEELKGHDRRRIFIMKREAQPTFLAQVSASHRTPILLGEIRYGERQLQRQRVVYALAGDFPASNRQ